MSAITRYWNHVAAVQAAAEPLGIEAVTQHADCKLRLRRGDEVQLWHPRFIAKIDGRFMYTVQPGPHTVGFAGWLPYERRQWPIAMDKAAFKRFAIANGIPTPAACFDPARIAGPFIIKQVDGSFGEGIRGPFRQYDPRDPEQQLAGNEFYEEFVFGVSAKAWCVDDQYVAVELQSPATVICDGQRTVRELCLSRTSVANEIDWSMVARLTRYGGIVSLDDVPESGRIVQLEFRHGATFSALRSAERTNYPPEFISMMFENVAHLVSRLALLYVGSPTIYALDAVISNDEAYLLEVNCNPVVHPRSYRLLVARSQQVPEQSTPHSASAEPGCNTDYPHR